MRKRSKAKIPDGNGMVVYNLKIRPAVLNSIKELAKQDGDRTPASVIRLAVEKYLSERAAQ